VGTIGLAITSEEKRIAELGIVIGRAYWGQGIGTSAARLVTGYAFGTLGLAEVRAEALQRNLASRRLLEKVGFHLLRAIPGDPHSDTDFEDRFLFVLSGQNRTPTWQRRDTVGKRSSPLVEILVVLSPVLGFFLAVAVAFVRFELFGGER
jgi:hypothetical protein